MDIFDKFNNSLNKDFQNILKFTKKDWFKLKNKKFFLTGMTGFFGYWVLRSIIEANKKYNLNCEITILTRNKNFKKTINYKLLKNNKLRYFVGDILDNKFPKKKFDFILHGASTSATETFNKIDQYKKVETIILGTKNILQFAIKSKCKKFIFFSSGSVYGYNNFKVRENSPSSINLEDSNFDLNILGSSKKLAENIIKYFSEKNNLNFTVLRCFSFIGPLIPLRIHYAVGNFLLKTLNNQDILIKGNPNTTRSLMYMSDLSVFIWKIVASKNKNRIYNLGSDEVIKIKDLAKLAKKISKKKISIKYSKNNKQNKTYYAPNINKIKKELGYKPIVSISKSIEKTYNNLIIFKKLYKY